MALAQLRCIPCERKDTFVTNRSSPTSWHNSPASFVSINGEYFEKIKESVVEGEINLDKINSGEEIVLIAPEKIGIYIEPDAIHIMKKSEFSNMFGDYSSFSDELERLSDTNEEENEEDE